jgi:hypothetical protein
MYHKVRNTLVAAVVAMTMIGAGYGVGSPPNDYATGLDMAAAAGASDAIDPLEGKRILGVRRHMAMPFFSFAPLLPRQGG